MHYFIKRGEKVQGPFTREQLLGFAKAKKVKAADLVGNSAEGPFQELKTIWSSISGSAETAQHQHQNTSTCSFCGTPVIKSATRCPICANPISPGLDPATSQLQAMQQHPNQQMNPAHLRSTNDWSAQPAKSQNKNKRTWLMIGGVAGGIVVIAGLMIFWRSIGVTENELGEIRTAESEEVKRRSNSLSGNSNSSKDPVEKFKSILHSVSCLNAGRTWVDTGASSYTIYEYVGGSLKYDVKKIDSSSATHRADLEFLVQRGPQSRSWGEKIVSAIFLFVDGKWYVDKFHLAPSSFPKADWAPDSDWTDNSTYVRPLAFLELISDLLYLVVRDLGAGSDNDHSCELTRDETPDDVREFFPEQQHREEFLLLPKADQEKLLAFLKAEQERIRAIRKEQERFLLLPKAKQEQILAIQKAEQERILAQPNIKNSINLELKLLPAGTFTYSGPKMGEAFGNGDWRVPVEEPFYIGVYEVTQEQYHAVMGANPSRFKGAKYPVEEVSWEGAVEFFRKLSELPEEKAAGRVYRLPTGAEWEYACRAGTTTTYSFGDEVNQLGEYSWFGAGRPGSQSDRPRPGEGLDHKPHPVGEKKPNNWGLYDMHGNVWERCQTPPHPELSGLFQQTLIRGGGFSSSAESCQSANKVMISPSPRSRVGIGLRVVMNFQDRP
jgi:formylglycine-generating enzyme required for sulfatase activity